MIDPMTSLSFSMYSGKGVHALLLGSGISRSSGIPTGWEIVLDLIRNVAAIQGQECGEDPEAWYRSTYEKEANYSDLLEMIAKTSAERRQILGPYFEPNTEEREAGKKVPTPAHHAIAKLVFDGYIRVIVTTNFDRLIERALEAAGVVPSVIDSTDSILGAAPLSQSRCTVIKIHGDYLDTRLKNTSKEIGRYDKVTNRLLNRVFEEYGLIVCGWSADWDVALRAAIERCPSRRYTMYWSAFREVGGAARELCRKRDAQVINGMGADDFFVKLSEKVAALEDMDAQHPLTARLAVATLKRYMAEDKDRIRLHDLMMGETGKVSTAVFSDLGTQRQIPALKEYEAQLETLLPLMAAGGYWGKATQRKLWLRCLQQLVTPRSGVDPLDVNRLDYYPAYLVLYAYGIASLAGARPGNLGYILARSNVKLANGQAYSLIHWLQMTLKDGELDNAIRGADPSYRNVASPTSQYLSKYLREPLREWIPTDSRYNELFCHFEYVIGLVLFDIYQKMDGLGFMAVAGTCLNRQTLPRDFEQEIKECKENWPFLRAGLFDGSLERLREVKIGFDEVFRRAGMGVQN